MSPNRNWHRRDFPRRPPMWWPHGDTWPPRRRYVWPHRPGFFVWRAVAFFISMLLAGGIACAATLWLLARLEQPGAAPQVLFGALGLVGLLLMLSLITGLRRLALPLSELIEAAGKVEGGDFSVRVHSRGPRELRLLGRAFNDMAERLQLTEAQRRNLLADVTHELRTPVAVIQGNLEGVLDGVYPADAEHLAPVLEEVQQLSHLIDDLGTLSQSESGALELHREPTDLAVLAGEVLAAFRPQAEGKGVQTTVEAPLDLPLAEVDPVRLREVLVNLIANSLRHTPARGEVTVRIGPAAGGGRLLLEVEDSGSGIAPDDLPHVFDRFYKARGSPGSGLGLTIARSLVEAHGGEIGADSAAGQGTTIRVRLPLAPEDFSS